MLPTQIIIMQYITKSPNNDLGDINSYGYGDSFTLHYISDACIGSLTDNNRSIRIYIPVNISKNVRQQDIHIVSFPTSFDTSTANGLITITNASVKDLYKGIYAISLGINCDPIANFQPYSTFAAVVTASFSIY